VIEPWILKDIAIVDLRHSFNACELDEIAEQVSDAFCGRVSISSPIDRRRVSLDDATSEYLGQLRTV